LTPISGRCNLPAYDLQHSPKVVGSAADEKRGSLSPSATLLLQSEAPPRVALSKQVRRSRAGCSAAGLEATLEEIPTTTLPGWNHTLDHSEIDDDPHVQQLIRTRILQLLINR
jgi:hypothetical protein